jgi:hypothetical protein
MTFLTPFLMQSSYSAFFICRDAFSMSGNWRPTPEQNNFIPAPVPVASTTTLIPGLARWNCSATARVKG